MTPRVERLELPDFRGGKLRDYAKWRRDWTNLISDHYDPVYELSMIRSRVPERVKGLVERLTTMEEVWALMDEEYGKKSELINDRVKCLNSFQFGKGTTSEAAKFMELYAMWSEVLIDLEIIKEEKALDHQPTISAFIKLLP